MTKKLTEEEREDLLNDVETVASEAEQNARNVADDLEQFGSSESYSDRVANARSAFDNFDALESSIDELRELLKKLGDL